MKIAHCFISAEKKDKISPVIFKFTALVRNDCVSFCSSFMRITTLIVGFSVLSNFNRLLAFQISFSIVISVIHCVKSVFILSFSGPYFPAFGLNTKRYYSVGMCENVDQKNSEYGHFSRSDQY